MECGGHFGGGGLQLQPHLARITLLIITGWTLKITSHGGILMVECTSVAVIDRDMNLQYANKADLEPNNFHHIQSNISNNNQDVFLAMTEDNHRDKMETEISFNATQNKATSPVLLIPDYIKDLVEDNKQRNSTRLDIHHNPPNNETVAPELEYQPGLVIRCAAKGHPRPNVTWEIDDEKLPLFVASTALTYSPPPRDGQHKQESQEPTLNKNSTATAEEVWVDLKLPKFNNAFYGSLRCRAENMYGHSSWKVELIHNANSSLFMKAVRVTIATFLLVVTILVIRLILWIDIRRKEKLYERLPPQDLEIIHKFKKGLHPPPTPATSSSVVHSTTTTSCNPSERGVPLTDDRDGNECVNGEGIEITVNCSDQSSVEATQEGYQSRKHDSYASENQQHSLKVKSPLGTSGSGGGGGASTPSSISCSSVHVLDSVNSWTNYVPYDDKLETSSKHFKVDYSTIVESGSYGMVFTGKLRNDINMEWINVAVKCGKTERDDNFLLESLLTELKILASLPKPHTNIVNLRGASTKLLHQRQAFLFVDHCENGNLATFIDLNRQNFRDAAQKSFENESTTTEVRVNENDGQHEVVISVEGGRNQSFSLKELLAWSWQISDGMKFLHKHKVIHGNLSTSNVYLTSRLTAKIGNIGYTPAADVLGHIETASKKYLTVPQFGVERFSRKSDVWEYGYVLWELFSLRQQRCPSREMIFELLRCDEENGDDDDDDDENIQNEMEIPQYATEDVFQLMLCCWNEDGTLRPEFHFFSKSFKQLYKGIFVRKKSSESNNGGSGISVV